MKCIDNNAIVEKFIDIGCIQEYNLNIEVFLWQT